MKGNIYLLALVVVLLSIAISSTRATNKKTQAQLSKHNKPEKVHNKQYLSGHWGSASEHRQDKTKNEHHSVKEVQKHAPLSVSHHEAKAQMDLQGHGKRKPSEGKGDLKLQDLLIEDAIHHKLQSHKHHATNHGDIAQPNHAHKNGHKMTANYAANNGRPTNKREKKAPKKVLLNKSKKNKRAKRLHKQYIF